jgi:hypothetical protein
MVGSISRRFPQVAFGHEMVAPVALDMDAADDGIGLQFLERGRHVGAGEPQRLDDRLGIDGLFGEIEQRMDLRDRAVDAPMRAHFAPMENEGLGVGMVEQGHQ